MLIRTIGIGHAMERADRRRCQARPPFGIGRECVAPSPLTHSGRTMLPGPDQDRPVADVLWSVSSRDVERPSGRRRRPLEANHFALAFRPARSANWPRPTPIRVRWPPSRPARGSLPAAATAAISRCGRDLPCAAAASRVRPHVASVAFGVTGESEVSYSDDTNSLADGRLISRASKSLPTKVDGRRLEAGQLEVALTRPPSIAHLSARPIATTIAQ